MIVEKQKLKQKKNSYWEYQGVMKYGELESDYLGENEPLPSDYLDVNYLDDDQQ